MLGLFFSSRTRGEELTVDNCGNGNPQCHIDFVCRGTTKTRWQESTVSESVRMKHKYERIVVLSRSNYVRNYLQVRFTKIPHTTRQCPSSFITQSQEECKDKRNGGSCRSSRTVQDSVVRYHKTIPYRSSHSRRFACHSFNSTHT